MSWVLGSVSRPLTTATVLALRGPSRLTALHARTMAYWNKDWKPGPYPRTQEEHAAAAKKYGLRVEDYEPYPDDGMGYGDYPKLPRIAAESRSANELWDMPEIKRNFGEPVHVDADIMVEDKWNPTTRMRYSFKQMLMWIGAVWGTMLAIYIISLPFPHFLPAMPKQMPKDGKKHYTFEPVE